jgi:ankyrin repeat protein
MKRLIAYATVLGTLMLGTAFANPSLDSALCDAAQNGTQAAIKALVEKGANTNVICSDWQATPLENAAHLDNVANMTALLDAGADVDAWSGGAACCQETALGYARSVPTASLLIARHANVNIRRAEDGYTPLIWLAMSASIASTDQSADNDTKIAQLLIDAGADANAAGNDGLTPLSIGIGAHSKSFVVLLLDHGANVNARNSFGVSPLGVTMNGENSPLATADEVQALREIDALLRSHGAVE